METVVSIIMAMAGFNFLLKLTCHGRAGRSVLCLAATLFINFTYEAATTQSKTQIADWLSQPDLMLDISVWLTVDVALQISFCVMCAKRLYSRLTRLERVVYEASLWFPGLLIFPVLFAALTELVFSLPGTDFDLIGKSMSAATLILIPLSAWILKRLLPETDIRMELMFMVNIIIAALGIVATVDGRTAAAGTSQVEWAALAAVLALLGTGTIGGLLYNKYITTKKISNLSK